MLPALPIDYMFNMQIWVKNCDLGAGCFYSKQQSAIQASQLGTPLHCTEPVIPKGTSAKPFPGEYKEDCALERNCQCVNEQPYQLGQASVVCRSRRAAWPSPSLSCPVYTIPQAIISYIDSHHQYLISTSMECLCNETMQ